MYDLKNIIKEVAPHFLINYEIYLIVICSLLGSTKAIVELDRQKSFCYKTLDITLGLIAGVLIAFHYSDNLSIWFRLGLAIIGGATGALLIETLLQMLPQILSKVIDKYLSTGSNQSTIRPDREE